MSQSNVLADMLGIKHPILQAGMGYVARADLCAAVSEAGALGVIGAASLSPEDLRTEIRKVREHTDRPFGVDILFATIGRPSAPAKCMMNESWATMTSRLSSHVANSSRLGVRDRRSVSIGGSSSTGHISDWLPSRTAA